MSFSVRYSFFIIKIIWHYVLSAYIFFSMPPHILYMNRNMIVWNTNKYLTSKIRVHGQILFVNAALLQFSHPLLFIFRKCLTRVRQYAINLWLTTQPGSFAHTPHNGITEDSWGKEPVVQDICDTHERQAVTQPL